MHNLSKLLKKFNRVLINKYLHHLMGMLRRCLPIIIWPFRNQRLLQVGRQVSELNNEVTKKIIKQQLAKLNLNSLSSIRNEVDVMKIQISSLKQLALKNINTMTNEQEHKQQILKKLNDKFQQYKDQTSRNLRQVIKKINESIKKQSQTHSQKFSNFVDDIQKQFLQIQDKIQFIQSHKIDYKSNKQPTIVSQSLDLRIKKIQRQLEVGKKNCGELQILIKESNQKYVGMNNKQNDDEEKWKEEAEKGRKNNQDIQKQIKNITKMLNELKLQSIELSKKLSKLQQNQQTNQKYMNDLINTSPPKQPTQLKQFLSSQKQLALSQLYQHPDKFSQPSLGLPQQQPQPLFKSPENNSNSPSRIDNNQPTEVVQPNVKSPTEKIVKNQIYYQIDQNNYLLDEDGNYILNQHGKEIQLSEDQICILRKSALIRLNQ